MSRQCTFEEILSWPKAELHCHLDGSLRLTTLLELARDQDKLDILPATTVEELETVLVEVDQSASLEAYLAWFRYTLPLMQSAESLYRIAFELAEDNARENVQYLEVRYGPILHMEGGLSIEEVNDAVLQGLKDASKKYDIETGVIVCGLRDRFESASMLQAELAVAYKDRGVVAFDLAGAESGNPPKHHLHAFYFARNHLLNLTVHAGESFGPESIRQALFYCGAHRIGHGITLDQDPELMQYFADHQIPLEICPTSNVQTQVVDSYESHPISKFVEAGVPVTVNTDNRLFSRTSVSRELHLVHTRCGVSCEDLQSIVRNGFKYGFTDIRTKQRLLKEVDSFFLNGAS